MVARELNERDMLNTLRNRNPALAEDIMRQSVMEAQKYFNEMYD